MTLEKKGSDEWVQKKYNLAFIWTPDTEERVIKVKNQLTETLWEEVDVEIVPFKKFKNTWWDPELMQSVRGKHVYIYVDLESNYQAQETLTDVNSRYMLMRWLLNVAKINWAKSLNIIFPAYAYARSDKWEKIGTKPTNKRKPIYTQIVASDLKAHGVDYIFTIDIHNPATLSMYGWDKDDPIPVHIPHSWVIQRALQQHGIVTNDYEMWSTDGWGTDKLQKLLEDLGINWYVAFKKRDETASNKVKKLFIEKGFAQITDKDIVLYDDIIDTASTLKQAVDEIWIHKPKSIIIVATHWLFNWEALQILQELYDAWKITAVYITDSVYREGLPEFIKIIPTDKIIARQIARKSQGKPLDPNRTWVEDDN